MIKHLLFTRFFVPLRGFGLCACIEGPTKLFCEVVGFRRVEALVAQEFLEGRDLDRIVGVVGLTDLGELYFVGCVDMVALDNAFFVTKYLEATRGTRLVAHLVVPLLTRVRPAGLLLFNFSVRRCEICSLVGLVGYGVELHTAVWDSSEGQNVVQRLFWRAIGGVFIPGRLWVKHARFGWTLKVFRKFEHPVVEVLRNSFIRGLERMIALGAAVVLGGGTAAGDRAVSLLVISLGRLDLAHVAFIA
jgi:hypothetical protein